MSNFRETFVSSFRQAKATAQKRHRRGGFKFWMSIITFVLIFIVLWAARKDLVEAWHLILNANLWILACIIPVQFASHYASTEISFTYLRARGMLKKMRPTTSAAVALEFNFVNHVFPTAGVSGTSYMIWRLRKLGISAGQAAMSQLLNYIILGGTFMVMMALALVWATFEDKAANWIVVATTVAIMVLVFIIAFGGYLISSRERLMSFARWLTRHINGFVRKITFGRRKSVLSAARMEDFFDDFYSDFRAIKDNKALLKWPIVWGFISNILDVLLIAIAFWALGTSVNLPILLIGFGASAIGSFLVVTPGGVGAYEAVMIGVLATSGMSAVMASSGVILARAILVLGTIIVGFFCYQSALRRYGRPDFKSAQDLEADLDRARADRDKK